MKHECSLPKPDLEIALDHLRYTSCVHTHASDIPAARRLPDDQPIWCWALDGGGKIMSGDFVIMPDLLVLPVDFCPFCGEALRLIENTDEWDPVVIYSSVRYFSRPYNDHELMEVGRIEGMTRVRKGPRIELGYIGQTTWVVPIIFQGSKYYLLESETVLA